MSVSTRGRRLYPLIACVQNQSKQTRDKSDVENNMSELSLSNVVFHDSPHVEQTNGRIVELEDELETWKKNYQQVKKRNRQLLVILQQGESKLKFFFCYIQKTLHFYLVDLVDLKNDSSTAFY